MPLPPSSPQRQLKHTRNIRVEAFARDDGLWEVDARISDVKTRDIRTANSVRPAGQPIHDLILRLVVDREFNVVASGAQSLAVPYPGYCDDHGDAYSALTGMNLLKGFKRAVRERLGGVAGCTHLTELADVLPTAVIQAFAGEVLDTRGEDGRQPFQLDRCHALALSSPVVQLHYPRWFRQPDANKLSQNCQPAQPAAPQGEPQLAESAPPLSS